ncbi:leucine-rich repeat and fibronectin type-III domain-containing protein 5-like [Mercenaria mercenaria]|uniref:leucine-rich repeat and fibronectin type-III domain-containing protein 5-like n=1 Tax=Mercenaria mercenaria TaxID=6596 RepID=UPI00234F78F5|nr:leucine-rich repeat and fibronectin type-III domain-containing protein 5-like [Mercenaria mercenaria]
MDLKMERFFILNTLTLILIISVERTSVLSCPTNCRCRGKAVKCSSGFSSFPAGLDATTVYLSISGTESQKNTISSLSKTDIQGIQSLFTLIITYSGVQTVQNDAFSILSNLHDLSLADNDIRTLTADSFKGLTKLRTLDLSGNTNCKLDKNVLTHISGLEELNLGNMNLQNLDKDFFTNLAQLKNLKLYMNGIKEIHQDVLAPLKALKTLDLNGNRLLGLPVELKPMFNNMNVHFSENPWQCNCQLLWLRELPGKLVSSPIDTSEIICNGPKSLKYHSFVNVPESNFICIPPKVIRCDQTKYSLDVNLRLTISCEYEGDPIPEVKFVRPDGFEIDGRDTVSGKYELSENGTLTISSVAIEDDGDWTVSAYNKTAHGDLKVNVHVIITTTSTTTTSTSTTSTTTSTTTTTTTTTPTTTLKLTQGKTTSKLANGPLASALSQNPVVATQAGATQAGVTHQQQAGATHQQQTAKPKSTINPDLLGPVDVIDTRSTKKVDSTTQSVRDGKDKVETVIKENPINYGLMAASAAGGGTIVGIICIIVMCCKKKQNNEKNKISPFEDDFDL